MTTQRVPLAERIRTLADPLVAAEGLELVQVETANEHGRKIIRLLIDKPGGVTLDDCTRVSREFSDLADIHLDIPGKYSLEVSSPGPERPLTKPADFARFAGKTIRIKAKTAIDGQNNFKGELLGISEDRVNLKLADKTVIIPHADIHAARLCQD